MTASSAGIQVVTADVLLDGTDLPNPAVGITLPPSSLGVTLEPALSSRPLALAPGRAHH